MIKFKVIASGSTGNSTLVQTKETNMLIDVGIPYRTMIQELSLAGLTIEDIDIVLITHEHIDHVRSLKYFPEAKIYSGAGTLMLKNSNVIEPYEKYEYKDLSFLPLPISHDCLNGLGYVIQNHNENLVYITDTGYIPHKHHKHLKGATHYIIEANHDVQMLWESSRPPYLIRRIASDNGHLSNEQCGEFLADVISMNTQTITLAHLSEEANEPELAIKTVKKVLQEQGLTYNHIEIKDAPRYGNGKEAE